MKKGAIFTVIALTGLIFLVSSRNTTSAVSPPNQIVGGECSYDEFDGLCKVLNLYFNSEKSSSKLVKFRFQPNVELNSASLVLLKKNNITEIDQEQVMNDVVPADWDQHDKNQVQIGDVFSCKLKIENSGTCTPVIFSFQDIVKNPAVYDDLAVKKTAIEISIFLLPIAIIIIVFVIKYEKFVHRINKVKNRKKNKK